MHSIRTAATFAASVALVAVAACGGGGERAADTPAAATDTGMAGMDHSKMAGDSAGGMAGMANMTGNADRDFLRMMSDHHAGLVAMARDAVGGGRAQASRADAQKLDTKQDSELERMQSMLASQFNDRYAPRVTPDNQQMVDDLKSKPAGAEYDRAFYGHVVMHHQQALRMIDEYLPKAQNAEIRAMAQKMRDDQAREIQEFQRRAGG